MKNILKNIIASVLLLSLISCSDFLNERPHGEVATEEAITDVGDAQTALYGTYAAMRDYWSQYAIPMADIMTNEVFAVNGVNSFKELQSYSFTSSNTEITNTWLTLYKAINRANNILNVVDGLPGDATQRNEVKGQTLTLRAIAYLELCKWFATPYNVDSTAYGVPIKTTSNANEEPQRSSVADVYSYIETDLLAAEKLLSKKTGVTVAEQKYISSWAVKSFLARFYLYKGDNEKAISYAAQVISANKFSIYNTFTPFSSMWKNDEGTEIIFMLGYTNTNLGASIGDHYYDISRSASAPKVSYAPSSSALLSLYTQFGPANNGKFGSEDIRYQSGSYFIQQQTSYNWAGYLCYKYPSNPSFTQVNMNQPKIIRLPELYLIRAEAYANLNNSTNALADYNFLRSKRIMNYANEKSFSMEKLKQEIFNERLRELCFEGFYWYDLKRSGKGFKRSLTDAEKTYADGVASALEVPSESYKWLLPIPLAEIQGNPDIIVNPGY